MAIESEVDKKFIQGNEGEIYNDEGTKFVHDRFKSVESTLLTWPEYLKAVAEKSFHPGNQIGERESSGIEFSLLNGSNYKISVVPSIISLGLKREDGFNIPSHFQLYMLIKRDRVNVTLGFEVIKGESVLYKNGSMSILENDQPKFPIEFDNLLPEFTSEIVV